MAKRQCEQCGGAVPDRMSRQRNDKGQLVCDSCKQIATPNWEEPKVANLSETDRAEMRKRMVEAVASVTRVARLRREAESRRATCPECGKEVAYTSKHGEWFCRPHNKPDGTPCSAEIITPREGSLQREAHDSGDNALIHHCPFCGSGAVTGRSDGSVDCDFCHNVFTVQVQPAHPFMPQTVDGQPVTPPGMPAGEESEISGPDDPAVAETEDGVAADPLDDAAPAPASDQPGGGGAKPKKPNPFEKKKPGENPFVKKTSRDRPAVHPLADEVGKVCSWCGGRDPDRGSTRYREKFDSTECKKAYWAWVEEDGDFGSPTKQAKFRTATGATLDEDAYLAHLALEHADDREAVLDVVRVANTQREAAGDIACPGCDGSGWNRFDEGPCGVCQGAGSVTWGEIEAYRTALEEAAEDGFSQAQQDLDDLNARYPRQAAKR